MRSTHWMAFAVAAFLAGVVPGVGAADARKPIPVADFTRDSDFLEAKLSPDGQYLATTRVTDGRVALQVLRLRDLEPVGAFGLKGSADVGDFYWPNDDSILFGLAYRLGSIGKPEYSGDLMLVNRDGTKPRHVLTAERGDALRVDMNLRDFEIVDLLRDDPDNILVSLYESNPAPYLYRLNLRTGKKMQLMQAHSRHADFVTDADGNVRFMLGTDVDANLIAHARLTEDGNWTEFGRYKPGKGALLPLALLGDHAFLAGNIDAATFGVFRFDLKTREQKLLFRDPVYDVTQLLWGRDHRTLIGAQVWGERLQWHFFDKTHPDAALFAQLRKAFGDRDVEFVSLSKDGSRAVLAVGSDVEPVTYYVVDLTTRAAITRLPTRRWIDPRQMSPQLAIEFKARDGTVIRGYVTVPRSRKPGEALPMIVLPHGGPHGVRDIWGFDDEVQLFASRGYVVLQPNFRGSSGYGRDFANAGYGEWGAAMQHDVIDATRWAMQQGYADPARICIYGTSYGAYAAMMAAALEPDLYRCVAGYAGVYDLEMLARKGDIASYDEGRAYLARAVGTDVDELRRRSPVTQAGRMKVPVFLAHGEEDRRAPLAQFSAMRAALKEANVPFEELVKEDEGHGFASEKNREDLYTRLLAFFDRALRSPAEPR